MGERAQKQQNLRPNSIDYYDKMWYNTKLCIYTEGGSVIKGYRKLGPTLNFDKIDIALRPAFIAKAHTDGVRTEHNYKTE